MAAILITMALALVRATRGPTIFDRILALNMFGTKTVLLIAVVCFTIERTDFLDVDHRAAVERAQRGEDRSRGRRGDPA